MNRKYEDMTTVVISILFTRCMGNGDSYEVLERVSIPVWDKLSVNERKKLVNEVMLRNREPYCDCSIYTYLDE